MADIVAIEWFYLISSLIISFISIGFAGTMITSFYRKRSVGSSFMMVSFIMIALGETLLTISLWLSAFGARIENIGILQVLFLNFICLAIIYFYYFSTRHILRDNELLKSYLLILSIELIAIVSVLTLTSIFGIEVKYLGGIDFQLPGTDITVFAPVWYMLIALFTPLVNFMLIRMIINLSQIHRKITDPVAKRGTTYIAYSVIALTTSLSFLTPFLIPQINSTPAIGVILQLLRLVATFLTMIFGYYGWVFPEWLKKRIRSKAWIVQAFKKIEGQELNYSYSSSKDTKVHEVPVQEVSDP